MVITDVIMYLRKSREDIEREKHTGEDTLSVHRQRLTSLCASNNYNFVERPEVVSGDTIAARPVFQNDYAENILPANLYSMHYHKTSKDIEVLKARLRKLNLEIKGNTQKHISPEEIQAILTKILNSWNKLSNKTKKAIIKSFFPKVERDKLGNLYITYAYPNSLDF